MWKTVKTSRLWAAFCLLALLAAACSPGPQTTFTPPVVTPPGDTAPAPATATRPPTESPAPTRPPTETPTAAVRQLPDPSGFWWRPLVNGLNRPVDVQFPPGESETAFIVLQDGQIVRLTPDGLQAEPFLDIRERVGTKGAEQGLLGLAFDPDYAANGRLYVNYTDRNGDTVIARFTRLDETRADPASEERLLQVGQPFANHNGGGLAFGPDGYLYIGLGDGGAAGDPLGNAQKTDTLLGKMLRIDVRPAEGYGIPPDNPFADGGGRLEIWALGLRNPWRFAFDPLTGDLWIGDVGQNQWEEIDLAPAGSSGLNFGWDYYEGTHPYEGSPPAGLALTPPVAEYDHNQGCSVTGGVVYRGALSAWQGVYLFGDFCSGTVWGLLPGASGWQMDALFRQMGNISSFGQDSAGEVYLLDYGGTLYRLEARP
jgi:glucose/arabinose dehydrogenase